MEGSQPHDLKFGSVYFNRSGQLSAMHMETGHPDQNGRFSVALAPGEYNLRFHSSFSSLDIRSVTLGGQPVKDWKLQIGESSAARKLIIIVGPKPQQ